MVFENYYLLIFLLFTNYIVKNLFFFFFTKPLLFFFLFCRYVSIHRYDNGSFYPPSKDGDPTMVGNLEIENVKGTNLNIGWNSKRVGDPDYLAAFDHCIMPACREFDPDLIYVSAGFDAARGTFFKKLKNNEIIVV